MKLVNAISLALGLTLSFAATAQGGKVASGQAASGAPIQVGQLASTTNPLTANMAKEYISGIEMAFKRVNDKGGVKGRPIKLVTKDDQFDANKAVELTDQLVSQDDIVAMVGNFGTQPLLKLADQGTLEKYKLASIGPMTGLQSALDKPNIFAVRASYEDEVQAMMQHAMRLGRNQVAYLYYEAGVGTHLSKLAPEMAKKAGVELIGPKGFAVTPDRTQQEAVVDKAAKELLGDKRPQAIVLIAVGGVHSEAVKALRKQYGVWMPIYSLGQVSAQSLIKDVGPDVANGVTLSQVMPVPLSTELQIVREFQADLKQQNSPDAQNPGYMLLEGYVTGRVTAELLRRSKTLNREAVLQAALNAGELNVAGYRLSYTPQKRKSVNRVELTMISRGKLVR